MKRPLILPYFVLTVFFIVMLSVQILLAGLSLTWRSTVWETHVGLGHLIPVLPLILLILALVGRLPLRLRTWSAVLLAGVLVQTELFVLIRELSGAAAAFHPLLAAGLFWEGSSSPSARGRYTESPCRRKRGGETRPRGRWPQGVGSPWTADPATDPACRATV